MPRGPTGSTSFAPRAQVLRRFFYRRSRCTAPARLFDLGGQMARLILAFVLGCGGAVEQQQQPPTPVATSADLAKVGTACDYYNGGDCGVGVKCVPLISGCLGERADTCGATHGVCLVTDCNVCPAPLAGSCGQGCWRPCDSTPTTTPRCATGRAARPPPAASSPLDRSYLLRRL